MALVEWAERLNDKYVPKERLEITFKIVSQQEGASMQDKISKTNKLNPYVVSMGKLFHHQMKAMMSSSEETVIDGDDEEYGEEDGDDEYDTESKLPETNVLPRIIEFIAYGPKWTAFVNALADITQDKSSVGESALEEVMVSDLHIVE